MEETEIEKNKWLDIKNFALITKDIADLWVKECEAGLAAKINSLETTTSRADKLLAIYITICTALGIYTLPKITSLFHDYLTYTALLCLIVSFWGAYYCWLNIKEYIQFDLGFNPNQIVKSSFIDNDFDEKLKYVNICVAICIEIQAKMDKNDISISKRSFNNQYAIRILFLIAICPLISLVLTLLIHLIYCF